MPAQPLYKDVLHYSFRFCCWRGPRPLSAGRTMANYEPVQAANVGIITSRHMNPSMMVVQEGSKVAHMLLSLKRHLRFAAHMHELS